MSSITAVAAQQPSRPFNKSNQPFMLARHFEMLFEMLGQQVFLMRPGCDVVFTAEARFMGHIAALRSAGIIIPAAGNGNYMISESGMEKAFAYLNMAYNNRKPNILTNN